MELLPCRILCNSSTSTDKRPRREESNLATSDKRSRRRDVMRTCHSSRKLCISASTKVPTRPLESKRCSKWFSWTRMAGTVARQQDSRRATLSMVSSNICHGAQLGGEHGWVVPVVAVGGLGPSRGSRGRGNGGTRVWGEDVSRRRAKRWLSCSSRRFCSCCRVCNSRSTSSTSSGCGRVTGSDRDIDRMSGR